METDIITYIKRAFIFIALIAIGAYSYYQARPLIAGPLLLIHTPQNNATIATTSVTVTGVSKRINTLTFNDREIFIDEEGNFSEKLLLPLGYTIIEVTARDRFNRSVSQTLQLVRIP